MAEGAAFSPLRWFARPAPRTAVFEGPLTISPQPHTRLLVLQPTPFCNIDCDYCYLPGRDQRQRMAPATARRAAERLREDGLAGEELTVVWHAGEPLVMPPAFYDQAFAAIGEALGPACRVVHSIQTNATLVDDAWCELFLRHGVRVGVSVDGPAALHDRHRRTRRGEGTHAAVLRALARLRAHGVPFHAIAVVTRETLADPDAFFDFFVEQGVHDLGCNFDEAEGAHAGSSLAGHEAAHEAFLERLLERSAASGKTLVVRELAAAWRLVAEPLPEYRFAGRAWPDNAQVMPGAILSVAWNGDFSTFSPELLGQASATLEDFVLGNVERHGFLERLAAPPAQRLWRAIALGVQACRESCSHFAYCGGGAPANKLYENGRFESAETLYCRSMTRRPFDLVLRRLEAESGAAGYRPRKQTATP